MDPTSIIPYDKVVANQAGSTGKFTIYEIPISSMDVLHYRLFFYMFSWGLRTLEKLFYPLIKSSDEIKVRKFFYWLIFIHNRVHLGLLNIFLSGGVIVNARTLLHLPLWPSYDYFKFDKLFAFLVLFAYWSDIMELYNCSSMQLETRKEKEDKKEKKKRMEVVKKEFEEYKKISLQLEKIEILER